MGLIVAWLPSVLAGLLLSTVLVALAKGTLTAARENVFKTFFYGGLAAFLASVALALFGSGSSAPVTLRITAEGAEGIPDAEVFVDGAPVSDAVVLRRDAEIRIDMGAAAAQLGVMRDRAEAAEAEAQTLSRRLERAEAVLEERTGVFEQVFARTSALAEDIAALRAEIGAEPNVLTDPTPDAGIEDTTEAAASPRTEGPTETTSTRSRPTATLSPVQRLNEAEQELRDVETFGTGIFR